MYRPKRVCSGRRRRVVCRASSGQASEVVMPMISRNIYDMEMDIVRRKSRQDYSLLRWRQRELLEIARLTGHDSRPRKSAKESWCVLQRGVVGIQEDGGLNEGVRSASHSCLFVLRAAVPRAQVLATPQANRNHPNLGYFVPRRAVTEIWFCL